MSHPSVQHRLVRLKWLAAIFLLPGAPLTAGGLLTTIDAWCPHQPWAYMVLSPLLIFGAGHLMTAYLLLRSRLAAFKVAKPIVAIWFLVAVLISLAGAVGASLGVVLVGIVAITGTIGVYDLLNRAKVELIDLLDWTDQPAPPRGFDPIMPAQPTVSDREK